jgi:hypothetical protein
MPEGRSPSRSRLTRLAVIPGLGGAESPGSMNTGLWNMDSGLAAAPSPGMTKGNVFPALTGP